MNTEKLKIGIIGTGARGVDCFGELLKKRTDVALTALCDPNSTRLKAASEQLGGGHELYSSPEEMLEKEELHGVIITSPDCFHEENAVACLSRKIDVLIDKPLSTTVSGCQSIIKAAEESQSHAMIGFNLRHHPVLKRLKEILEEGTLGKVFLIENREFYNGGRTYMSRWNRDYKSSGGLWVHKGSHDFDVFNWLLNFPKPKRVSALAGINVLNADNLPFEVKDGVEAGPCCNDCAYLSKCPDAKAQSDLPMWNKETYKEDSYRRDECMYLSEKDTHDNGLSIVEYEGGIRASHLECFICSTTDRMYTLVGDKGMAEVSLAKRTIQVRPRWSQEIINEELPPASEGTHGGADPGLLEAFIQVLKGELDNKSTLTHGMISTAIGQAAEISSRENRTVELDELLK